MTTHSSSELQQKLSRLQKRQQTRQRCYLWRSLFVSGVASSILTLATSSYWQIKSSSQVIVNGDRDLAVNAIEGFLNVSYPQSIVTVSTGQINRRLETISALESVRVTKSLFPPAVRIYLQERVPVATAVSSGKIGFLDRHGVWLDPNFYQDSATILPNNSIKVVNFMPQYSILWSEIYSLIIAYQTIDVREVHWDERGNLWLVASQFKVFLGSDSSLLKRQFTALASFPNSNSERSLHRVTQIDLSNPDVPFLTVSGKK